MKIKCLQNDLKYMKFTHLRLFFIFLSAKYIESFARYFPKVNS